MNREVEPMDVDDISEFDDKENSLKHTNVLPQSTEKGYEELDYSEYNMKLRYSMTPNASPMSKSYTVNRGTENDGCINEENKNLTQSLNSAMKSPKTLPLQSLPNENIVDGSRNSVLRPLDGTMILNEANVTVTITNDSDENLSLPSTSSSPSHTPEVTTPVKDVEVPKPHGSPILRGLKNVLNMFRPSQSPIPAENQIEKAKEDLSPEIVYSPENKAGDSRQSVLASTPISSQRKDKVSPKRDSIVFNEDLEKELQWKDETTIIFSQEKIPIHKLFFQHAKPTELNHVPTKLENKMDTIMEPMDISYNDKTITETDVVSTDSINKENTLEVENDESVFLDCETTFTMNESQALDTTRDVLMPLPSDNDNNTLNVTNKLLNSIRKSNITSEDSNLSIQSAKIVSLIEELTESKSENEKITDFNSTKNISNTETEHEILQSSEPIPRNIEKIKSNDIKDSSTTEDVNKQDHTLNIEEQNIQNTTNNKNEIIDNVPNSIDELARLNDLVDKQSIMLHAEDEFVDAEFALQNNQFSIEGNVQEKINESKETVTIPKQEKKDVEKSIVDCCEDPINDPLDIDVKPENISSGEEPNDDVGTAELLGLISVTNAVADIIEHEILPTVEPTSAEIINEEHPESLADVKVTSLSHEEKSTSQENKMNESLNQPIISSKLDVELNEMITNIIEDSPNKENENEDTKKPKETITEALPELIIENKMNITELAPKEPVEDVNEQVLPIVNQCSEVKDTITVESISSQNEEPSVLQLNYENEKDKQFGTTEITKDVESNICPENVVGNECTVKELIESKCDQQVVLDRTDMTEIVTNIEAKEKADDVCVEIEKSEIEEQEKEKCKIENGEEISQTATDSLSVPKQVEDEEIVLSEDNSPYVSLSAEIEEPVELLDNFETIENPFESKSKIRSPPIVSKGYNFNFDEIENPFVSKTKVAASPVPINDKSFEPIEKITDLGNVPVDLPIKPEAIKLSTAAILESSVAKKQEAQSLADSIETVPIIHEENKVSEDFGNIEVKSQSHEVSDGISEDNMIETMSPDRNKTVTIDGDLKPEILTNQVEDILKAKNKIDECRLPPDVTSSNESMTTCQDEIKIVSSSEYLTATSSSEDFDSKPCYALPDFDEADLDPFATKTKIRQSPILKGDIENRFDENTRISISPDSITSVKENFTNANLEFVKEDKLDEKNLKENDKEAGSNVSTTCSEGTDDRDETVREIHTEDEETMEGPFIEADLGNDIEKLDISEHIDEEIKDFTEVPPQTQDENFEAGEMFIDADAFDFLMNQNKSCEVSDSGKESLFLKFDPLFSKRVNSDGVVEALGKLQKQQSTPKKTIPQNKQHLRSAMKSPVPGPSSEINDSKHGFSYGELISEEINEDLNVTVAQKPTMAVPPAVNPAVTPRSKATTPSRQNRHSFNFTSPAMAVIDRLLSLSANNSPVNDTTVSQMTSDQVEAEHALIELRELLAEKELNVHYLRDESKELRDRLDTLMSQVTTLEQEGEKRLRNINELNEKLAEKNRLNKNMFTVVEEYERTIAGLTAGKEEDKKKHAEEREQLIKERDEQTAHLSSMEVAFSDLHSKYEKSKQIILLYKSKEDVFRKNLDEYEQSLEKMEKNYETLKQHASSKLNHANQELEKINKSHESEVLKLNAMIKRKDLHISSLEETLAQKMKANDELTAICDELINKVG